MKQKLVPYVHSDGQTWDHFFVDPKTGIIYFERRMDRKRIKFSTKTTNGIKAKRIANEQLAVRLGIKKKFVRTLISEELKLWLLIKEGESLKYDTLNNVRRAARQIEEFWGDLLPSEIDRDKCAEWYAWWRQKHPDIEMENAIKYFRNFCKYLHEKVVHGHALLPAIPRIADPNRKKIKAQRQRKKERIISSEEFAKIYRTAATPAEGLVVLFMYTMATRIDETLKLEFGSTILLDREYPVYRWFIDTNKAELKGQNLLHLALIKPLQALQEQRSFEGTRLLFPQKMDNTRPLREQLIDWEAWRERANLGWHWTPHTFRHTALTNLMAAGVQHGLICTAFKISIQVLLETYYHVTMEELLSARGKIQVNL